MRPFSPAIPGRTVSINVSSSSQAVRVSDNGPDSVRVMNNGTATVWIAFGGPTITASASTHLPVGPGVTEVFTFRNLDGSDLWIAAIAAGSTGLIYFTPGTGL